MKQNFFFLIKIASTILITSALGLEVWYASTIFTDTIFPDELYSIFRLGSLALVAHFIEGIIAAFKAQKSEKNFINYGVYTFFVGFVGLLELES